MDKISGVQIRMSTEFEEQFNTEYLSRIFPWALNYSCGGPDYANLFDNWDHLAHENYSGRENGHSRRPLDAPILDAGKFHQMLATRCEAQIASDWMLVPAARNIHWRYMVLHNSFIVTKRQLLKICPIKLKPEKAFYEKEKMNRGLCLLLLRSLFHE